MRTFVLLTLMLSTLAHASQCLTYSGEVTLKGILLKQTFPEEPNYESIKKGDRPATYFFIKPRRPFCVAKGEDLFEDHEAKVNKVQLVFVKKVKAAYTALRPFLGKQIVCTGSLFHAENGHHHTPVLLWQANCGLSQQNLSTAKSNTANH